MTVRLLLPWYRYPPFRASGLGGLSIAIWELTHQLVREGVKVETLTPDWRGHEEVKDVDGIGVHTSAIGTKLLKNRGLSKEEEGLLLGDYDLIFSVNNYAAKTLNRSPRLRERVVRQIHTLAHDRTLNSYVTMKPNLLEYAKVAYSRHVERRHEKLLRGTKTLCVSKYLATMISRHNIELPQRIFHVPNGIDTTKFRPLYQESTYDLLFVGRFQKVKGLDLLLKTLRLLMNKGIRYSLGIAGEFDRQERQYLLNTYCKGIEDSVAFLGTVAREDLPRTLNSAKILVIPSRYESFGLPALEALACGVPVVASRTGGLPEIIDNSVGRLFENENLQALAKAICDSHDDYKLSESAAIEGPMRAKPYDWKEVAQRIIALLKEQIPTSIIP